MNASVFENPETFESWNDAYYTPITERFYDRAFREMMQRTGANPGDLIVDAGCGPGVHTVRLAKFGYRVLAVDISGSALRTARLRLVGEECRKAALAQADLRFLPLPTGKFQRVVSWGVVIHIEDAEAALEDLARLVAPGGWLALYVNVESSVDLKLERAARRLLRLPRLKLERRPLGVGCRYEMHGDPLWLWRFNPDALHRFMAERGLICRDVIAGEFTELQRRTRGFVRRGLCRLNNAYHRFRLPPRGASANLLFYQRNWPPAKQVGPPRHAQDPSSIQGSEPSRPLTPMARVVRTEDIDTARGCRV